MVIGDDLNSTFRNWKAQQHKTGHTFGTAAWKTKSVYALEDRFIKVAWIVVVCGLPGCLERLNVNLKELLSNAVIDG